MSLILSRREIDFLLFEWLDVETLFERARYADHDRDTVSATLDLCQSMAEELLAPHNKIEDHNELVMQADGRVLLLTERSEEHTSELKSLMRIPYAVTC